MKRHTWQITLEVGTQWAGDRVVHVERKDVEARLKVLVHAEVVLLEFKVGVQRALPPAMCLVTLKGWSCKKIDIDKVISVASGGKQKKEEHKDRLFFYVKLINVV